MGQERLNGLLEDNPEVEKRHYKLWLASKAVLDRALHNAAYTRSEFKVDEVYEKAKRYVASDAFPNALTMIEQYRVVIIAGPPGVGKTTLADLLLYRYLEAGYQPVLIQKSIEQGEDLFQKGVKQVFYFDDFMGATFLGDRPGGMAGVHDQALLNFIGMVRRNPDARLILTTREHIYSYAKSRSEKLRHSDLDDLRVFLHMPSYTLQQKARILYNHVFFSDLPDEYVEELLREGFYLQIVKHDGYNPRLIEWLSSYNRLRTTPVGEYQAFILKLLKDPYVIWEHAYKEELTEAGRSLLLAIHSLGGKSGQSLIRKAFAKLHSTRSAHYRFQSRPEDCQIATQEAANVFIKPWGQNGLEVLNPSVLDLMNTVVTNTPENAVDVVTGAVVIDQVEHLWGLAKTGQGHAIITALRDNAEQLAKVVETLAVKDRKVSAPGGGFGYMGPSFEGRLEMIVDIAHRTGSSLWAAIIAPVYQRLLTELEAEHIQIGPGVELVRILEYAKVPNAEPMATALRKAILAEAQDGCRADELREIITIIDTSSPDTPDAVAARAIFAKFETDYFSDDLSGCRSDNDFSGLVEDLDFMREQLKVDVDYLFGRVEEAREEYSEHQEAYADSMQDHWKEDMYFERDTDRSVSDMFGSLKGDGD